MRAIFKKVRHFWIQENLKMPKKMSRNTQKMFSNGNLIHQGRRKLNFAVQEVISFLTSPVSLDTP